MPALQARLAMPVELAFDGEGKLYVGQCAFAPGQSVIDRIDSRGVLDRIAGSGELGFGADGARALDTKIDCPAGLAFGLDGLFYFADHGNNRIRRVDGDGTIRTVAGNGPAGVDLGSFSGDGGPATAATLHEPWGIAFDSKGNLYIADRDNNRVRKVDIHGVITTLAGTGVTGFSGDGGPATKAQLCGPQGLAVDRTDNLYIADDCNDRIRRVDRGGTITTFAGKGLVVVGAGGSVGDGGPAAFAELDGPDGLAFGVDGSLYVATNPGLRVRRIDTKGLSSTMAGTGLAGTPTEGAMATTASFPELYGLAFDVDGNLYVADGSSAIYRIDTAGVVTRFAGAP
jgi:sugar lactone lactonase YvrE